MGEMINVYILVGKPQRKRPCDLRKLYGKIKIKWSLEKSGMVFVNMVVMILTGILAGNMTTTHFKAQY
jgi:hypothetical protein